MECSRLCPLQSLSAKTAISSVHKASESAASLHFRLSLPFQAHYSGSPDAVCQHAAAPAALPLLLPCPHSLPAWTAETKISVSHLAAVHKS